MQISLIITTYNWPQALDLVLRSVSLQTRMPDEVIVADDGSGEETTRVVEAWAGKLRVPLLHLWQEDNGFRLSRSRNRAIAAARGEYVILLDGDMVIDRHFVEDHERASEPGWFVQGIRIHTSPAGAARMLKEGVTSVSPLMAGVRRRHLAVRSPFLSSLFSRSSLPMSRVKSCNEAFWRADLIAVNGFEERMIGWGPEDKECVARLLHSGVRGKELRFAALATHLHHATRSAGAPGPNDALYATTIATRATRCVLGLDQHLVEFAGGIPPTARPPWRA